MAKLIDKDKCTFESLHIVKDNEVVGISLEVWCQLNRLELMAQQYEYLKDQPEKQDGPSLDGFVRKTLADKKMPYVEVPETPVCDARVAEAIAFMKEVDACERANEINQMLDNFKELIMFCSDAKFIEGNCFNAIDTPVIGNPLRLSADDVKDIFITIASSPIVLED